MSTFFKLPIISHSPSPIQRHLRRVDTTLPLTGHNKLCYSSSDMNHHYLVSDHLLRTYLDPRHSAVVVPLFIVDVHDHVVVVRVVLPVLLLLPELSRSLGLCKGPPQCMF